MARYLDLGLNSIDLWRSQEMQLVQLMIPAESAHDTVGALGELGLLQFKDLNSSKSAFQKTYASQVKRCDEMSRKLRFFKEQVTKAEVYLHRPFSGTADKTFDLDELETKLEELEAEVLEVNSNNDRLQRSKSELDELQLVLEKAGSFFDSARTYAHVETFESGITEDIGAPLLDSALASDQKSGRLGFIAGLIQQEKLNGFERLLFRATRGNVFLKTAAVGTVVDPTSGEQQEKSVFMVFFSGERARTKILKICEAFNANRYPFPEEPTRQRQMNSEVTARLRELQHTIEAGQRHRSGLLQNIANNIDDWTHCVNREKAIYHTMNKFSVDVTHKVLVAEAWVPTSAKPQVHEALKRSMELGSTQVATILQPLITHDPPPTYFKTSLFTESFQAIVDAYGVARYREANPTTYTIITFPFLFAVMFGDFGHGWLLFLFGLYLVVNEKKWLHKELNDMFAMIFGGRYVIMLMGVFSIFVGMLYNEFFSMPMMLFGDTKYRCCEAAHFDANTGVCSKKYTPPGGDIRNCVRKVVNGTTYLDNVIYFGDSYAAGGSPYPLGVDPIWHGTKSELPYLNSLKMKMSIILAVVHMNLGIIHSLFNHLYFHDWLSIYTEFIPQMLFFNSVFGYLSILIVHKWNTQSVLDSQAVSKDVVSAHPDLYNVMITLFLNMGVPDPKGHCYEGQSGVQGFLLFVALVSVPWMLVPKPLILKKRHEARSLGRQDSEEYGMLRTEEELEDGGRTPVVAEHGGGHGGHGHGDHFEFGEVMVHQMIHTIEFVLGAISNTASYLRLWALSLAHSQLSAVFYDRVLMLTVGMAADSEAGGPNTAAIIAMIIGFAVFFSATMGVLMVMESLSAFLHALRLHWVEFMNKFYQGDGYPFVPFSFETKAVSE